MYGSWSWSFRSFRFKMLPTWLNDTPFRTTQGHRKDCRESIYDFGSRLALQCRGSSFRSFRFKMLPTWLNDTLFRRKDCRESIYAFGSRLALQCSVL